ncbi:Innexin inx2, partial [Fragariocoptes setiger]
MDVFGSLRSVLKIDEVCIDNNVFRLHYKVTVIFLLGCSILVTSRQYFGDPIDCIQRDDIPANIIDTYCWIHATFTLPGAYNKTIGTEVPHPGVDKYSPGEERVYHKYYQWVCFVLFLQAVMFYIPRYMWKMWENQKLRHLVLNLSNPILGDDAKKAEISMLVQYLNRNTSTHKPYLYFFALCEALNFFNVCFQMYLVDAFLGGTFSTYGLDVVRYSEMDQDDRNDPMIRIFPRMTKCTFHRYGSSGDVQKHDALCILPLNIINEKIYIFLWFWFVFLALISGGILIYRVCIIMMDRLRFRVLYQRARLAKKDELKSILEAGDVGDWFLMYMLCKNMDALHFRAVIHKLAISQGGTGDEETDKLVDNQDHEAYPLAPTLSTSEKPPIRD